MAAHPIESEVNFQEALDILSREERFMGTVSAMNALLIQKGVYSADEFESVFVQWAMAQLQRPKAKRIGSPD